MRSGKAIRKKSKTRPLALGILCAGAILCALILFFSLRRISDEQGIGDSDSNRESLSGAQIPFHPLPEVEIVSPYPPSPVPTADEFEAIRRAAEAGDAESQLYLGHFHVNGDLVERDFETGAEWYRKAAEQGLARAQYYLGFLYECGVGVERDYAESFKWYMKAVEQDDPAAHLGIAGFHFAFRMDYMPMQFGDYSRWRLKAAYLSDRFASLTPGVEECLWNAYHANAAYYQNDSVVAEEMYARAQAGDSEASLYLSKLALHAQGMNRDLAIVSGLMRASASQGNKTAALILGSIDPLNEIIDIDQSSSEARKYLIYAAQDTTEPYIQFTYHQAYIYENFLYKKFRNVKNRRTIPDKPPSDEGLAEHAQGLRQLADNGYARAQYYYASAVFLGYAGNISENRDYILSLFKKAHKTGLDRAGIYAGTMMLFGNGSQQDLLNGKMILDQAIYSSDAGVFSIFSDSVRILSTRDPAMAVRIQDWLRMIGLRGDANALLYLGIFTEKVQKNEELAIDLYIEAANLGADPAVINIGLKSLAKWMRKSQKDFSRIVPLNGDIATRTAIHMEFNYSFNNDVLINIPAGMNGYGPAILEILREFTWEKQPLGKDRDVLDFWIERYFSHKNLFSINRYVPKPSEIFYEIESKIFDKEAKSLNVGKLYNMYFNF